MSRRSDASLAALLLVQRLTEMPAAAPLKGSEYWSLVDRVPDPGALLGLDSAAISNVSGLGLDEADRIQRLLDAGTALAFELDELERSGLRALSSLDEDYPAELIRRLGRGAPPVLYVAGVPELMAGDLLGIVGSRDVGEEGAAVARGAAREAAAHGFGVLSGGAKGVDRLAMGAALECGARSVGVVADSLVRTLRESETRRAITDGMLCLCTPYKPTAGFTVANAMGRNKIIYGLSRATLVVAADHERGGTWAGAVEALRHDIAPVVVWTGDGGGPGNAELVKLGASPLDEMDALYPLPARPELPPLAAAAQLSLEV